MDIHVTVLMDGMGPTVTITSMNVTGMFSSSTVIRYYFAAVSINTASPVFNNLSLTRPLFCSEQSHTPFRLVCYTDTIYFSPQ